MFEIRCSKATLMAKLISSSSAQPSKLPWIPNPEGPRKPMPTLTFRTVRYNNPCNEILFAAYRQRSEAVGNNISRFAVKSVSDRPFESENESGGRKNSWDSVKYNIDVFIRFTRVYALIGRIIGILSISVLAMDNLSDFSTLYLKGVLKALAAAVLMSLYITGLNQLTDIEIDKVNKPYLPLASGEYSFATGVLITVISPILGFWIGWFEGSLQLLWALFGLFFVGTVYSLDVPLLRWKKHGFLAALCLVALWGIILPLPFYFHFQTHLLRKQAVFSRSLIFTTTFTSFFSMVIALFKDIPDVEGDMIFGIQSFTSRLGQKRMFWICIGLLEMAYIVSIFVGAMSPNSWRKLAMILGHSVMAAMLWIRAIRADLTNQDATQSFYMFLWKLLYAEYLLVPFVRF